MRDLIVPPSSQKPAGPYPAAGTPDRGARSSLDRLASLATFGIVALAVVLRAPGLFGWWLNPDEGVYYSAITREHFADFWAEATATAHPPLYFLILRGSAWLTTDFTWLRSLALISGCAAVYVFTLVGRELGLGLSGEPARGRLAGLFAGLFLALSPRAVVLSQVIRPYMLLILLLGGAFYALLRYLRLPSTKLLVAHVACSSLAVLLHYSAAFALVVFGVLVMSDGAARGPDRVVWRRLLVAQSIPLLTLLAVYVWRLRALMDSAMADAALDGWLAAYLIRSPIDAWLGLVGSLSSLVGDALAASAAILILIGIAWAARDRCWVVLSVVPSALACAVAGALMRLYPFGPTRHTSWLFVFIAPGLAWTLAALLTTGRSARPYTASLVAALVIAAGPLRWALDSDLRPREISEHVLREPYLAAMADVLDPQERPELVLMSTETYFLLVPLFKAEREMAAESRDGGFRFSWGARKVVVLPGRDFAALPNELGRPNHVYTAAQRAEADFGVHAPSNGDPVLVLAGGWRSQGVQDLVELSRRFGSFGTTTSVPGLIALSLDLDAYGRALAELAPD